MEDFNYKVGDKLHIKYLPNTNNEDGGFDKIETLIDKDGVLFFGDKEFVFYDNRNELYSIKKLRESENNCKGTPFKEGFDPRRNYNGRPPETEEQKIVKKAQKELIAEYKEKLAEALPLISPVLIAKAMEGDMQAIKEVNDRVMGKAEAKTDITSNGKDLIPETVTKEEKEALLNLLK